MTDPVPAKDGQSVVPRLKLRLVKETVRFFSSESPAMGCLGSTVSGCQASTCTTSGCVTTTGTVDSCATFSGECCCGPK